MVLLVLIYCTIGKYVDMNTIFNSLQQLYAVEQGAAVLHYSYTVPRNHGAQAPNLI